MVMNALYPIRSCKHCPNTLSGYNDGDDGDDDGDDDDDDGSKQRVGDHMIPPPTAVGGPTASNRHRILQEVNTKINTKTKKIK